MMFLLDDNFKIKMFLCQNIVENQNIEYTKLEIH